RTLEGFPDIVFTVTVSPDGRMAVAGGRGGLVTAWDLASGKRFYEIKGKPRVLFSLALSPDGRLLASARRHAKAPGGHQAGALQVWDLATGMEIRELKDGTDTVTSVAFSPDGKLLASGNVDRKVRLWDAATGQLVAQMQGHEKLVRAVAFSPDGRLLATGG